MERSGMKNLSKTKNWNLILRRPPFGETPQNDYEKNYRHSAGDSFSSKHLSNK